MFQDLSFAENFTFPVTVHFGQIWETGGSLCDFSWEFIDTVGNFHSIGFSGHPIPENTNSFTVDSVEELDDLF